MVHKVSWQDIIKSERGLTLLEIMVTLVIVCMFVVVITQFMGLSFRDIFDKGNKMQAAAKAESLMEKITAIVENNNEAGLDDTLQDLAGYVDDENDLLVYNAAQPVQFFYEKPVYKDIDDSDSTPDVKGIDVDIVVFYKNGAASYRLKNFIYTG